MAPLWQQVLLSPSNRKSQINVFSACVPTGSGRKGVEEKRGVQKFPVDGCTVGPKDIDMKLYMNQFRPILDKVLSFAADMGVSSSV